MQVVSVDVDTFLQYYLVAMATSLSKSSARNVLSYGVRIVKIGPVDPEILDQIGPFFAVSYQTFTNEPCQLWSYFTEFHEIFTRYTGITCAVNAPIDVAISHTVSECQSDKCRSVGNFTPFLHKIGCLFNVPWDIEKSGPDRSSTAKMLSFDVKIAKIGPMDLEIICLWEIIKKDDN